MNQFLTIAVTVSSIFLGSVISYPTSVPEQACVSMVPGHGGTARNDVPPYNVEVSPKVVRGGDVVQVILYGSIPFQGFYLQGRTPQGVPVGTFIRGDIVKTHNCNGQGNAAFHGVRGPKNNLEIYWQAPKNYQGEITFIATFVQEFDTYWTFVRGNPITVKIDEKKGPPIPSKSQNGTSSDSKNQTIEIVPRIMNREPEVADSERHHSFFDTSQVDILSGDQTASSSPLNNAGLSPNHFNVNGFGSRNRNPRYPIQQLRGASNFYSIHEPEQSPLFHLMQINSNELNNNWRINSNNQQRYENKITKRQQYPFPYKLEYNGNPNHYESHLNTFPFQSSHPSPHYGNDGSGSLVEAANPGIGHRGHRKTTWVMDNNRFQNFKDVDDLIPPPPPAHPVVPSSKRGTFPRLQNSLVDRLRHPLVQVSPIGQLPTSPFNLGSGHHHRHPSQIPNMYLNTPAPVEPSLPVDPFKGHGHGHHGVHQLQSHTHGAQHHRRPSQFPTHGYLVHNPKSNGHGHEPPFYLIPASKHDVDNVRGQYFNHHDMDSLTNPFGHHKYAFPLS